MRLHELKTQALRYVALGDVARAMAVYAHLLRAMPNDLDVRMKVADLLVGCNLPDLARRVYAGLMFYDLQLGRPLHGIVCAHALHGLGEHLSPLYQPIAHRYAAESPSLAVGGGGARLSPPDPDAEAGAPLLPEGTPTPQEILTYAEHLAAHAASTTDLGTLPERYPPVPLLSELPADAFLALLQHAIVRRVPAGTALLRQGEPGTSFFLVASGVVRVYVGHAASRAAGPDGPPELARLGEGAIFGELALVSAQPRAATVEAVTEVDVIELGVEALKGIASALPRVAEVLDRFARDRLLKNLLATSPLFRPFSPQQRLDLARRFTGHEVAAGTDVIHENEAGRGLFIVLTGELEVVRGREPFEKSLAILRAGALFGEISLVRVTPATATVRAVVPSTVLFLSREYFEKLTAALPELRAFFEELSEERLRVIKDVQRASDELELADEDLFLV